MTPSCLFVCLFTDNAGVIVNNKGEMKGKCVYIQVIDETEICGNL